MKKNVEVQEETHLYWMFLPASYMFFSGPLAVLGGSKESVV